MLTEVCSIAVTRVFADGRIRADRGVSCRHDVNAGKRGGTMARRKTAPLVGVVMGSDSDWEIMRHAVVQLEAFGVACEARVLSAHRMPDDMFEYAGQAQSRGLR